MKILIVEDEFVSRLVLQKILSSFGESHIAKDGLEALEALKVALGRNAPYDIVTLDIMMPNLNGASTLRAIREIEEKSSSDHKVNIIFTSSLGMHESELPPLDSRTEVYLQKPITTASIKSALKSLQLSSC